MGTTQDCYDKQVGTHPKEIYVTECKIDYVEECPEPSYGRVKRDTSEDEEENSRVKRQSQSCFGSNCNQNNFGGFPQFVPQQPLDSDLGLPRLVLEASATRTTENRGILLWHNLIFIYSWNKCMTLDFYK